MKKRFLGLAVFFLAAAMVAGEDAGSKNFPKSFLNSLNFSVQPFFSTHFEKQTEEVYQLVNSKNKTISLIEYEETPSYAAGAKASVTFLNIILSGGGYYTLPLASGTVKDYDWLNYSNTDSEIASYLTNYSEHTKNTETEYGFSGDLGYCFVSGKKQNIIPFAGIDYTYSMYKAVNGYYKYGKSMSSFSNTYYSCDDSDETHVTSGTFSGDVLSLERFRYTTWLGLKYILSLNDFYIIGASLAVSPYTYVQSLDSHLKRTTPTYFYDEMNGIFKGVKLALSASCNFSKHQSLALNLTGYFIYVSGSSYSGTDKNSLYSLDSTAGASFYSLDVNLFYQWRFR